MNWVYICHRRMIRKEGHDGIVTDSGHEPRSDRQIATPAEIYEYPKLALCG